MNLRPERAAFMSAMMKSLHDMSSERMEPTTLQTLNGCWP